MNKLGYTEQETLDMPPRKFFLMFEQYLELNGHKKARFAESIDDLP